MSWDALERLTLFEFGLLQGKPTSDVEVNLSLFARQKYLAAWPVLPLAPSNPQAQDHLCLPKARHAAAAQRNLPRRLGSPTSRAKDNTYVQNHRS